MTADRSAAADTLRDELAALVDSAYMGAGRDQIRKGMAAFLAKVDRYADAQVAAERERIAAAIEAIVPIARRDMRPVDAKIQAHAEAARIARGQP